jgi:chromosome segregation ATPase
MNQKPAARSVEAPTDEQHDQDAAPEDAGLRRAEELEAKNASLQKELEVLRQQLLREGSELVAVKGLLEQKNKELAEANALLQVERKEHAQAKQQLEAELVAERHELGEKTNKLAIVRITLSKTSRELTKERFEKSAAQGKAARLEKRVTELSRCISGASALMNKVNGSDEQEGEDDEEEEDNIGTEEEEEEDGDNESTASTAGDLEDADGLNGTWKGHFERLKLFKETHGGRVDPTSKEDKVCVCSLWSPVTR